MIDVKTIYEDEPFGWYDYDPMINAFGNVVIQVSDNDYQGDTRVLYNNNGKIGHLIFGWGSCSGCDALQACESYDDLQELCNELENDIEWFDDAKEALAWFKSHDWQGDFIWHDENGMKYVEQAISYLYNLAGKEE